MIEHPRRRCGRRGALDRAQKGLTVILSYRIPELSGRMRAATLSATRRQAEGASIHQMIEQLERRGYRVTRADRAA